MILFRIYVTTVVKLYHNNCKTFFYNGFFYNLIQLCDSRKIHYLTHEFRVKLHLKTDIGFRVQFNAEFPRQVMNFPIESPLTANSFQRPLFLSWRKVCTFTLILTSVPQMSNSSVSEASVAWRSLEGTSWRILVEPPSSVIGI